jgi:magnesium-protoporphyrin IX monomethyl ester (oxidative) cyclase
MYLNDLQRAEFYATIGLEARQFDKYVIRKTNQSSGTLFPVILDVDNPLFYELMEVCAEANQSLIDLEKQESAFTFIQKLGNYMKMGTSLVRMFLMPAIETKYIWTESF